MSQKGLRMIPAQEGPRGRTVGIPVWLLWHLDVALGTPYEFGWQKGGLEWHEECLLFL
ncbi:hypothetical protein DEO72_LG2g2806 [Vigna unguiculata]|uniref:Uncharacterized protein n=1 Tax=Vigna unguiculata TaxID=3917 RepID=A0A4D6L1S1_VIGUN|nr:hypothetical protein DEO72_LG2g2806 [Vigna unguiculata]